ncbi:MAG: PKD domain-containing protein [Bacillota bacterium]
MTVKGSSTQKSPMGTGRSKHTYLRPGLVSTARLVMAIFLILTHSGISLTRAAGDHEMAGIPLVLISEPVKGGQNNRKDCLWSRSGLVSRLESSGYEPGKNLFIWVPDRPYKDLDSGALVIRSMLDRVLIDTGWKKVNVAAYGVSGLVLRVGLESGLINDGFIENAIMLSAPQRGSFLTGFLLNACQIAKHESIFERDTRQARFSPFGNLGEPLDGKGIPSKSTGELPSAIGSDKFEWESEAWWVAKRASEIYEPLYARYVKERFMSLPYFPIDSPKETFPGWIKSNWPLVWKNCIVQGEVPPFGPMPLLSQGHVAVDRGQDLTTAYYEILAMDVARNQYVMRMASQGSLAKSLFSEDYVPSDWKDALIHYGCKALIHYAKKALVTVKAEVQKLITDSIVRSIEYLDDPESLFLRRLVKEDVLVNLGTSLGQRFTRVKTNHYLGSLNSRSSSESMKRKARYISLTGRISNLAGLIWPQIAPNNFFCEVDSAIPPQGPRDVVKVFSGILSPSYLDLLKDKRVQDSIVALISEAPQAGEVAVKEGQRRDMEVSSWHPSYVSAHWAMSQSEIFRVSLDVQSPPEGWGYLIWVEGYDGGQWLPLPECTELMTAGKDVNVILQDQSYRVGIRLTRLGIANPFTPGGRTESAFEKELTRKIRVDVDSMDSGSGLDGTGLPGYTEDQGPNADFPEDPTGDGEGIPGVRVVYRNKHTTLWKPEEVCHLYWEVDFGDGDSDVIQGQPHLVISHTFDAPGSYPVRLISYDNHGRVLLEKTWKVEVSPEEAVDYEFSCTSVVAPEVKLELSGPKKWVTGKYGVFTGQVTWELPENAHVVKTDCDPGEKFQVLWERSGEFTVLWGVRLTIDYELEGKVVQVKNTYVRSMTVDVFTSGIVR